MRIIFMSKIRLDPQVIKIIRKTFVQYFLPDDKLWIFGSRVNSERKGGDIDLYIETYFKDLVDINYAKSQFWSVLQNMLGEQKIDIIINAMEFDGTELPVYRIAKETGIQLFGMKKMNLKSLEKLERLKSEIEICDVHASRIQIALEHLKSLIPIQLEQLQQLSDEEMSFFDQVVYRFSKLQDTVGDKVFPIILELWLETNINNKSFADQLNLLEKFEILENAEYWRDMREVRNSIAHEYPNKPIFMVDQLNKIISRAFSLLTYWDQLKNKVREKFLAHEK